MDVENLKTKELDPGPSSDSDIELGQMPSEEIIQKINEHEQEISVDEVDIEIEDDDEHPEETSSNTTNAHNEREFIQLMITSDRFVKIADKVFHSLMTISFFLLVSYWGAALDNYNFFPFNIAPTNNAWYYLAQIAFLMSYLMTNTLILRLIAILGYVLFIIWSFSVLDMEVGIAMDFLLFTFINIFINLKKIIELLYEKRPIVFDPFREKIYQAIFKTIMTRNEFQKFTKNSLLRDLKKDSFYCKTGDRCVSLSILIFGKLQIFTNNENSNIYIDQDEFIDSAEWILLQSGYKKRGKRFNYSIIAREDCKYLTWPREMLSEILVENETLEQKLTAILGIDVSNKMFSHSSLFK